MTRKQIQALALILAGAFYVNLSSQRRSCVPCSLVASETSQKADEGHTCAVAVEVPSVPVAVTVTAVKGPVRNAPPAFAAFDDWTVRWKGVGQGERAGLEAEGVALAKERRRRMADIMLANPEQALELAAPYAVRKSLPVGVVSLLEEPVNTMGSLHVAGVLPLPGKEGDTQPGVRWAEAGGHVYEVATFGEGMNFLTKKRAPLNGIALPAEAATNLPTNAAVRADMVMALAPNPARELEAEEIADRLAGKTETCPESGDEVQSKGTPGVVELGGELHSFCGPEHMRQWSAAAVEEFALTTPDPDYPVMASGGDGEVAAAGLPVAASGYTEGYKRVLFLRPRFSDSSSALADTMSDAQATTLMNAFIAHMYAMSWGKLRIAPLGPGGSQFTTALAMGKPAGDYNDQGLSKLYPEARNVAQAAGYNLGDYAFAAVFTGGRPAAGYAGLAYVGGVGIHIANGYYGLSTFVHEFGHNLGLPHAHTWDTGDNSIIGDGSNVEYGDNHDPMGSGNDAMHYLTSHKASLDWIPGAECPRIGTAGIYRVHVSDEPKNGNGLRAIRVARNGSLDYWFDFRQTVGGTEFGNGLIMHWSNTDGRNSYRTDALPKQNGITLPVGMTFTDRNAGVHVTPLAVRADAFPRAMDVAVGFTVAGNRAPVARLIQHSAWVAGGAEATWTVEATDADGDTLAYYWDFGDGTHSWDSQPVQTKAFGSDGEYAVHCVVSDTRGGVWRKTVVQKSGALPANQVRISGRVVDGDSKPMPGIRVSTDGSLYAWTDTDGSYALCRVPVGVHAISAMDVVENKTAFSRTFSSGTNWTANTSGADISLTETAPEITTTLVAKLSTWKYNDSGVDLGTAWRATTYNDTTWAQGPGMLGYGNGAEGTVISYGGDAQNKRTTAYFRRRFTVADPSAFTEVRLRCNRDDAVMVYLNGTKIYQDNFASTVTEANITYATTAADSTEPGSYQQQNGISKSLLVAGDNWLCAEVHQVEPTSSDLAFDAELMGISVAPAPGAQAAYVSSPEPGGLIPAGTPVVTLTAEARARTATVTKVEFYADGTKIGEDTSTPFSVDWNNPAAGTHALHVVASFSVGTPLTSAAVSVTVGTPSVTLIGAGSVWKWRAATTAPPANWMAVDFNDSTWSSGPAQLGYGDGDENTNTSPGGTKYERTQFRRTFIVADPLAVSELLCYVVRDDAAVVYLNGTEAFRHNFSAAGTVQAAGGDENGWQLSPVNAALLRPGVNTLAVEIYQDSPTSSDASFDLALEAKLGTARARGVYMTAPAPVVAPAFPVIAAEVVPGGTLGVAKVEFFNDGVLIGEDGSYPFAFTWVAATAGAHQVTAVATDSVGGTFTGPGVTVTVRNPAQATTLVKWGDTWKYWDNGTDPGPNWVGRTSFDDTAWAEGAARFGYGGDGEVTSLFVNDASAKAPTVYFRKKFTVPDPAAYDALRLRVIRDDGVSVQINRVELLRDNLPEGTLNFSTLASAGATDEQTPVETIVPTTALRAGENQLTVEVHQNAANSSDLSFDLELTGLKSPAPAVPSVWLTSPAGGETILSDDPLVCGIGFAALPAGIQRVEYYIGAAKAGEAVLSPWAFTWGSALKGTYAVSARVHLANGAILTTAPATVAVTSPTVTQDLIWSGADWKYLDTGTAPAATWTGSAFSDTAWKTGRSRLGFGGDGEITGVAPGHITYWFRKSFGVPTGVTLTGATLRVIRDDGIQLFLNGNRIWLDNLPDPPAATDVANASIGGADEQTWNTVPLSLTALQPGNNVLAAEIHQSSATSSDVAFDLELSVRWLTPGGLTNTVPATAPRVTLAPAGSNGLLFSFPETAGRIYSIESSLNLGTWTTESTHVTSGSGLSVPLLYNGPKRYYRAKWRSAP